MKLYRVTHGRWWMVGKYIQVYIYNIIDEHAYTIHIMNTDIRREFIKIQNTLVSIYSSPPKSSPSAPRTSKSSPY